MKSIIAGLLFLALLGNAYPGEFSWKYVWPGWFGAATLWEQGFCDLVQKEARGKYILIVKYDNAESTRHWWLTRFSENLASISYGHSDGPNNIIKDGDVLIDAVDISKESGFLTALITSPSGVREFDALRFAKADGTYYVVASALSAVSIRAGEDIGPNIAAKAIEDILETMRTAGNRHVLAPSEISGPQIRHTPNDPSRTSSAGK
jgi:hypothetical protein